MPVNVDTAAMPLAERLLGCLCPQLELTTGGPVCACCVTTGPPVLDCCACAQSGTGGYAWVRVVRIYPSGARFPALLNTLERCPITSLAVELELGVVRCSHQVTDDGSPAGCDAMLADAEMVLDDAAAMRRALNCCFGTGLGDPLVLGQWQSYGPDGGCVGGSMTLVVRAFDAYPADLPPIE